MVSKEHHLSARGTLRGLCGGGMKKGALRIRIGFLSRGSIKGCYKGSIVGFYNTGALIIRIGFGVIGFWGSS